MRRLVGYLGLIIVGWGASAMATEYPWPLPKDEDIIKQVDRIVLARCLNYEVRNGRRGYPADDTGVWTYVDFETVDMIKGKFPQRFTIRVSGGTIGEMTVGNDEPLPKFQREEQAVLLLGPDNQDGHPIISSTTNWIYRTTQDPSGLLVVINPPAIQLLKVGTKDALHTGRPIDAERCPNDPDPLEDPGCAMLKATGGTMPPEFSKAKSHDFSEPVAVADVVWSIRQILQKSSQALSDGTLPARH